MTFSTLILPHDNHGAGVGFTDRLGGVSEPPFDSFNLGIGADSDEAVMRNFDDLRAYTECPRIAITAQIHGTDVAEVDESFPLQSARSFGPQSTQYTRVADAMVSTMDGVGLAIRVADCVPILFADFHNRITGAAHAGRVGLLAGVVQHTVSAMRKRGADRITAWVGPHICPLCYEVPQDMARAAWSTIPSSEAQSAQGTPAIDLGQGVHTLLDEEGVTVVRCDPCTSCDPTFFSYRRDTRGTANGKPKLTGRQVGMIWLQ